MVLKNTTTKICKVCEETQPADQFYIKKPGLLESQCKTCKKVKRQRKTRNKNEIKETTHKPINKLKQPHPVQVREHEDIEELKGFFKLLIKLRRKYE